MAYGTPSDPVAGTVITVAYAKSNILDPIRWLRLLTGNADPPGSAYVVVSTSTSGTSWQKLPTDAIADGAVTLAKLAAGVVVAQLGYTPIPNGLVNRGDAAASTTTYFAQVNQSGGATDMPSASWWYLLTFQFIGSDQRWQIIQDYADASHTYFRLVVNGVGGAWHKLWTDANDGSGSGLDADLLDGQDGTFYQARANHTGTQAAATISDFAATVAGLPAASAAAATNASQLGGVAASGYARFATGSYTGNGVSPRQVLVGFACKYVRIITVASGVVGQFDLVSATATDNTNLFGNSPATTGVMNTSRLHASDGFVVDPGADNTNNTATIYHYAAWG